MTNRVFEPKPDQAPMTKSERREAARIAKAQLAARARQRKIGINVLAAVAVAAVLVGGYFWIGSSTGGDPSASPTTAVSPTASKTAALPFPGVPAGADERL